MQAKTDKPTLLTRDQAAEYLGVARSTLEAWAYSQRCELPYIKVGRLVRYRLSDLEAFLTKNTVGGAANG